MKKSLLKVIIMFLLVIVTPMVSFSQTAVKSSSPTVSQTITQTASNFLTIKESDLKTVVQAQIKKAVEEAVATAVKEERAKTIDVQNQLDKKVIDYDALNIKYEAAKKDNMNKLWLGLGCGAAAGTIITTLIVIGIQSLAK